MSTSSSGNVIQEPTARQRRPERQLYVPPSRRAAVVTATESTAPSVDIVEGKFKNMSIAWGKESPRATGNDDKTTPPPRALKSKRRKEENSNDNPTPSASHKYDSHKPWPFKFEPRKKTGWSAQTLHEDQQFPSASAVENDNPINYTESAKSPKRNGGSGWGDNMMSCDEFLQSPQADAMRRQIKRSSQFRTTGGEPQFTLTDTNNKCRSAYIDLRNEIKENMRQLRFWDTHTHSEFFPGRFAMSDYIRLFDVAMSTDTEKILLQQCEGIILDYCKPDFVRQRKKGFPYNFGIDYMIECSSKKNWVHPKVRFGVGVHPTAHTEYLYNQNELRQHFERRLRDDKQVSQRRLVTAGEFGIDFKRMQQNEAEIAQRDVFESLLNVVKNVAPELPLQLHVRNENASNRRADDVALECMQNVEKLSLCNDETVAQANVLREAHHRHCFTGDVRAMRVWQKTAPNAYFGFTNAVWTNGYGHLHNVIKELPLDRVLIETDAPFFTPPCYDATSTTHPGHALMVAKFIAGVHKRPLLIVCEQLNENVKRLYGLETRPADNHPAEGEVA